VVTAILHEYCCHSSKTKTMNKLQFSISINAPREKVWNTLWDNDTYRQWTSIFNEGSHAVTDWKEGSKVLFLGNTGDGMYGLIRKADKHAYLSIEHQGMVKDGVEQPQDDSANEWYGAHENYTLEDINGSTRLTVEIDVTPKFEDYFNQTFPAALEKVKQLSEA
jgi:uncharacterized protein YndB with AHSA1/START domain